MKKFEKNDPIWKLLKASRQVDPSPFFSRNVVREVRKLREAGQDRPGVFESILTFFRKPSFSVLAGSAAAIAILAIVFGSTGPAGSPNVAEFSSSVRTVGGIPVVEFNPAEEIENFGYLGDLMAVSDPADLDDEALADLYLMVSR